MQIKKNYDIKLDIMNGNKSWCHHLQVDALKDHGAAIQFQRANINRPIIHAETYLCKYQLKYVTARRRGNKRTAFFLYLFDSDLILIWFDFLLFCLTSFFLLTFVGEHFSSVVLYRYSFVHSFHRSGSIYDNCCATWHWPDPLLFLFQSNFLDEIDLFLWKV